MTQSLNASTKMKKTPIGKIPVDWEVRRLRDVAEVQTGIAKGKKNIKDPVKLPYLRVANVQDGYLDLSEIKYITVASREVDHFSLRRHDVLFTEGGDLDKLGRGFVWHGQIALCLHQNHIFVVRPDNTILLPYILTAYASSYQGRKYFLSCAKQTTNLASINSNQLKSLPIALPPLLEQKKIAEILGTWDRAIAKTEKLIQTKQKLKKALMQQLLTGKTRFKEFQEQAWKEYRLKDLLKEVKRPLEFDDDAEYDLISVRRRSGGLFLREKLSGHQIKTKDMSVIRTGDFLISKMQVLHGASGLTTEQFDGKNISGSYIALVAKNPQHLDIHFFDYLSRTPYMYHLAYISSYGVHIEKMTFNLKLYLKSQVRIPATIEEQTRICSAIDVIEREITPLTTSLEALQNQKKGLMQKLLTGKVRVEV